MELHSFSLELPSETTHAEAHNAGAQRGAVPSTLACNPSNGETPSNER